MDDAGRAPQPQHQLFTASLSAAPVGAGFSQQATFFVAFFGGPLAAVIFNAWNARIWGRLERDLPLVIATGLVAVAAVVAASVYGAQPDAPKSSSQVRVLARVLALAIWGAFVLRHRSMYRMQALSSLSPRRPWVPGIACVVASVALVMAIGFTVRLILGTP